MLIDTAFHPEQLIPLVHAQHPLRRDVIRALQLCNAGQWVSAKVVQLVWEVKESILREQLLVQTDEDSSMVLDVFWRMDGSAVSIFFKIRFTNLHIYVPGSYAAGDFFTTKKTACGTVASVAVWGSIAW